MTREIKRTITLTLVFSVFFASSLCCCLTGASHAASTAITSESAENHCHSNDSKTTHSKDSKDCKCQQTAAIIDVKGVDSLKPDLSLAKFSDNLFAQSYSLNKTAKKSAILTEHFPPIAYKKAIPPYLANSVFRL